MRNRGIRQLAGLAAASAIALGLAGAGAALAAPDNPRTARSAEGVDMSRVIVQLSGEPLATSTAVERSGNDKVLFNAAETRNVRADLVRERNAFRQWLQRNAPEARITGQFDIALNGVAVELNGTPISVIRRAPGVTAVGYENVYTPMDMEDPDLTLIDAFLGWDAAGAVAADGEPADWAGHGITVGVIDSGIDITHPCFDGGGYPAQEIPDTGDPRFTNDKVVVAKVFNNRLNQSRFTAEAVEAHGTHVAGTIACELDTPAVVHGVTIPYAVSGVAPGAQLGNYNVFPGTVESARSEDILNALDAAAEDGMDVINMSIGGPANGNRDLLTNAVDNLDRAGIV
ncbi:MAG: S8 family serine peptidase, partial [Actinomycetes bacterium]|nr:S8 family serine peptidase [Actinomycetes bacterium]